MVQANSQPDIQEIQIEEQVSLLAVTKQVTNSKNVLNEIFAFLNGSVIIHKIALLNKRVRYEVLPDKGPVSQTRVITFLSAPASLPT